MSRQLFQHDGDIGYRFVPGLKARVPRPGGGYLIRTNSLGFRCDREVMPERSEGFRRVLLFGDSYTAGDLVSNGKRYGDLLEQRVPRLEVLNFGLPGTGTDQHYLTYKKFGAGIEHDLLIIAVQVENIRRVVAQARRFLDDQGREVLYAKPYYEMRDGELLLQNIPVPKRPLEPGGAGNGVSSRVNRGGRFPALRKVINRLGLSGVTQQVARYQPLPEYDRADHPAWLLMRAILERWIVEHEGATLLLLVPLYQYVEKISDPSSYRKRFAELAADTGCTLHDPLDDLWAYSKRKRETFRFERNPHPSEAGHQALAESLAPRVESLLEQLPPEGGAR